MVPSVYTNERLYVFFINVIFSSINVKLSESNISQLQMELIDELPFPKAFKLFYIAW